MTTEPTIEAAPAGDPTSTSEASLPTRIRIRWGWFLGCIVLGLAAIAIGWLLTPSADRLGYVGGVLAGIGTTLLLVGIVVLLERRIVDTAVKVVRDVAKEARIRADEEMRARVEEFEGRVADVWDTATPEDAAEETRRMVDQFTRSVAEMFAGDESSRGKVT